MEQSRPEPVRPDYDGAWIGAVIPGLLASRPPDWLPDAAATARRIVLLVLDGLGWNLLRGRAAHAPTLASMDGGRITAVAPTTTAAALTSLTTFATPAEHGLVGFRIRLPEGVLNVLRWRIDGTGRWPDPVALQPLPAFGGVPVPVVTQSIHASSGFTQAHLRGAQFVGWPTPAVLVKQVLDLVAAGQRFVYVYYDGIDKVAHQCGLSDGSLDVELAASDELIARLLSRLPGDVALVVTADHGQVEIGPAGIDRLAALDPLVREQAGESRFRSLFARPGGAAELLAAAQELAGGQAWVWSREALFDEGWLGPGAHDGIRRRVGDVVLAPFADVAYGDATYPLEELMLGRHGSLTADEMLVPLLAARGQA